MPQSRDMSYVFLDDFFRAFALGLSTDVKLYRKKQKPTRLGILVGIIVFESFKIVSFDNLL